MTWHPDEDQLNDFLEEMLPREDEERVRAHVAGCSHCQNELAGLSELLTELGRLPMEAMPARDLWPQIEWRMGERAAPEFVEPGPLRRGARRVTLPAWQLLAASLVVALLSGGSVWMVLHQPPEGPVPAAPVVSGTAQMASLPPAFEGYDDAVAELEAVLALGREVLDEETLQVLEENLKIIDRAIRDAQEALVMDPASGVLQRVLAGNLRRKMSLLRQAALSVYANS